MTFRRASRLGDGQPVPPLPKTRRAKRDWSEPRKKVDSEFQRCRVCGGPYAEAAHLIPRSRVGPPAGEAQANVVPLCRRHHRAYDEGGFDLLPFVTPVEWAYAVSLVGVVEAGMRLSNRRAA
jgi:5-methylcytosine-specific restriction endonuclease McrA